MYTFVHLPLASTAADVFIISTVNVRWSKTVVGGRWQVDSRKEDINIPLCYGRDAGTADRPLVHLVLLVGLVLKTITQFTVNT